MWATIRLRMKRRPTRRLYRHLSRGDRVFIPADRMARIRWEESVLNSELAREGVDEPRLTHVICHCGSMECVGVPCEATRSMLRFPSRDDGSLVVSQSGIITEATVWISHNPEGKFALWITDPTGQTHHRVSVRDPWASRATRDRWIELPEVVGKQVQGTWRLIVRDHTVGEGALLRPWWLGASIRDAAAG